MVTDKAESLMQRFAAIALALCSLWWSPRAGATQGEIPLDEAPLYIVRSDVFLTWCTDAQDPEFRSACEFYLYGVYWTMVDNSTVLTNAKWNNTDVPKELREQLKPNALCLPKYGSYPTPKQVRLAWMDWLNSHQDQMRVAVVITAKAAFHDLYPCK
jgi:hypothetical protein